MKQYLLSVCYPAGSTQPAPAAVTKILSDVKALRGEMQSAASGCSVADSMPPTRQRFCATKTATSY
jgi:hypothetical protein